jgi:hypothetical protein
MREQRSVANPASVEIDVVVVTDASNLNVVVDAVHDLWFDVDQVERDCSGRIVTFLLYNDSRDLDQKASPCAMLRFKEVDCLLIRDTENVGYYDIGQIRFDSSARVFTITGGVTIILKLHVAKIDIEVSPAV